MPTYTHKSGAEQVVTVAGSPEDTRLSDHKDWKPGDVPAPTRTKRAEVASVAPDPEETD